MNMYTSTRGFRKGVSLWIPITVFLSVMALIIALLPTTSSARADELVAEGIEIGEIADGLQTLDEPILIEDPASPPAQVGEDPVPPTDGGVDEGEGGLLDDLVNLISPAQIAPQQVTPGLRDVAVEATGIVAPGGQDGNIFVGDTVEISGTWDASTLSPNLQNGDFFYIPIPDPPLRIVDSDMDIIGPGGLVWGTCEAEVGASRYVCTLDSLPANTFGAQGTWGGNATAMAEYDGIPGGIFGDLEIVIQNPSADYSIAKTGAIGYNENWIGDEPAGTVLNYTAMVNSTNFDTVTEDIVIRDVFDSELRACLENRMTVTQAGPLEFTTQVDGDGFVMTIERPANGFHRTLPIVINYYLCTVSGGMDPRGTLYDNFIETTINDVNVSDEVQVEQRLRTWIDAINVDRGSFDLRKVVDEDTLPDGYDLVDEPFTVFVEEFTPDGVLETDYELTVPANGTSPIRGLNSRPAGWTIRISEIAFPNAPPGYEWGTPVFSGAGVTTGVGANGPYGEIVTTQEGNVGIVLTNIVQGRTPQIGTVAAVQGSVDDILPLTGGTVIDTINYENLQPNTEYELEGQIVAVDTDGTVTPTGITGSSTFTTGAGNPLADGSTTMEFTITAAQAERWANQRLVVYERLFEPSGPTPAIPVVVHEDPDDEAQTFFVDEAEPLIGTLAQVQDVANPKLLPLTGGEVVDTVSYRFLDPETEYRLDGELMHVAEDGTVTPTGIIAGTTFTTPAAAPGENYVSGTVDVTFTISAAQAFEYGGESLVVYERLFEPSGPTPETPVAIHENPEDEDQTFRIPPRTPEIGTLAQVQGDDPKLLPLTGGEVVDTVSYTDLLPNTEYRLDGELMHVATNGTVTATGIIADTTFTTPAAAPGENYVSGTVEVTFTISATAAAEYAGESLVVYERLFQPSGPTPETPVAVHENPEDEDQTFAVEPGGTIVVGKTVTGPKGDDVENDDDAVFQIRAEWIDNQGNEQSRTFNVTPGQPVTLDGLPLDTEITLTEIGADTSVSNVKWGDIIWSGTGVVDAPGASPNGTVTLTEPGATIRVGLENKTSSNGLIIIPIPLPLFPGGQPPVPPAAPVAPTPPPPQAAPAVPEVSPKDGVQPSPKDGVQPQRGAAPQAQQKTGLAATGADVVWLAGGGIMILLLGAWLVLRGRRNES